VSSLLRFEKLDPNIKNQTGRAPLIEAIRRGEVQSVRPFYECKRAVVWGDGNKQTILHHAAIRSQTDILAELLERKAIKPIINA
jgi:ankyrin repeat protein